MLSEGIKIFQYTNYKRIKFNKVREKHKKNKKNHLQYHYTKVFSHVLLQPKNWFRIA